jgi:diadenylate cyclase
VTKELLVSLFLPEPENSVHDGAVLVKNLRVHRAGAVLPLSANPKLDKALGTRHRAAIGITEETDAVVVVVSEERGSVALCFGGNIARDLDGATLRKALLGLFHKEKRRKSDAPQPGGKRRSDPREPTQPIQAHPAAVTRPIPLTDRTEKEEAPKPTATEESGTGTGTGTGTDDPSGAPVEAAK